jgi:hypothetical protein
MQLDQIIIKPGTNKMILQYSDEASRGNSLVVDVAGNNSVAAVVTEAQQRLPTPQNRPDREQIQKEIQILEARVEAMKESIGGCRRQRSTSLRTEVSELLAGTFLGGWVLFRRDAARTGSDAGIEFGHGRR